MIHIKNQREIDIMRKAGYIHAWAMEELRKHVVPGITTLQLDKIAEDFIAKRGASPSFKGYRVEGYPVFPASICTSVNEEVIHGIPSSRQLREGDIISIDMGVFLDGYHADGARTFPVGNITANAQKLIEVTQESFFKGIDLAREGNWLRDISSTIQETVEAEGLSVVRDFVGHGIGEEMHEEPQVPNYKTRMRGPRLEKGLALAIEPMVNEGTFRVVSHKNSWRVVTQDGLLSAHYENTIIVTDNEPLVITYLESNG
jgi:methionyl aminopeptidase